MRSPAPEASPLKAEGARTRVDPGGSPGIWGVFQGLYEGLWRVIRVNGIFLKAYIRLYEGLYTGLCFGVLIRVHTGVSGGLSPGIRGF